MKLTLQHVELLNRAKSGKFPIKIYPERDDVNFALYEELVTERFIDARPERDGMELLMYVHQEVTDRGFAALDAYQTALEQNKP